MENAMVKNEDFVEVSPVMFMDDGEKMIADLTCRTTSMCSLKAETMEEKAVLYKVMNNPEKRTGDCINTVIKVKDIFVEAIKMTNDAGEESIQPRIVLVDENNIGYQSVSVGIFSAVRKLISVFGQPTWSPAIPLKVIQVTKGERKLLTLDVATK